MTQGLWSGVLDVWVAQAWAVSAAWAWKAAEVTQGLPKVPDLLAQEWDHAPATGPSLTVIVPALNEAADVADCLNSLLAQEYAPIKILAVDDRSTDATGGVMDSIAALHPGRIQVVHIKELPDGWLGKTHAMALAANMCDSDYLLFTDADIFFRPDALCRSMAYAVASGADHMVTMPTLILKRWDEAALLSFFQVGAMWASRPWKVADPKAKRDAVGVGAFNLMRRDAYERAGGFEALRMEIIEDLGMARRIKNLGMRQRIAYGLGLVSVYWAPGAFGVVKTVTKNIFSAFRFRVPLIFAACIWIFAFYVLPLMVVTSRLRLPALITASAIALTYVATRRQSGISAWNALLAPFAALLMIYTLLRSMMTTLRQGGVVWRGTFYPLAELKKHVAPFP